jgi:hypothetical protein
MGCVNAKAAAPAASVPGVEAFKQPPQPLPAHVPILSLEDGAIHRRRSGGGAPGGHPAAGNYDFVPGEPAGAAASSTAAAPPAHAAVEAAPGLHNTSKMVYVVRNQPDAAQRVSG